MIIFGVVRRVDQSRLTAFQRNSFIRRTSWTFLCDWPTLHLRIGPSAYHDILLSMPTLDEIRAIRNTFSDAVEEHASAHKVIAAAKALREVYRSLPKAEQMDLIEWVRLRSDLDTFINGENRTYYVQIAVLQKGLRRANLEHLERYSSEETGVIDGEHDDGDEYVFNIWRSEWRYIENFLKQFEISYRVVSGSLEGDVSPPATADFLS